MFGSRQLEIQLRDLGINYAFTIKQETNSRKLPEDTIIDVCNFLHYRNNKKYMANLLLWLNSYSSLIYVDSLYKRLYRLNPQGLALVLSISEKLLKSGDARWLKISRRCLDLVDREIEIDDKAFVKRKGENPELLKYNIRIANIIASDDKKLAIRSKVLSNPWLRNRVFLGVNLRADIYTIIENNLSPTAYSAAKLVLASQRAVYKNWNELSEYKTLTASLIT